MRGPHLDLGDVGEGRVQIWLIAVACTGAERRSGRHYAWDAGWSVGLEGDGRHQGGPVRRVVGLAALRDANWSREVSSAPPRFFYARAGRAVVGKAGCADDKHADRTRRAASGRVAMWSPMPGALPPVPSSPNAVREGETGRRQASNTATREGLAERRGGPAWPAPCEFVVGGRSPGWQERTFSTLARGRGLGGSLAAGNKQHRPSPLQALHAATAPPRRTSPPAARRGAASPPGLRCRPAGGAALLHSRAAQLQLTSLPHAGTPAAAGPSRAAARLTRPPTFRAAARTRATSCQSAARRARAARSSARARGARR